MVLGCQDLIGGKILCNLTLGIGITFRKMSTHPYSIIYLVHVW